MSLSNKLSDIMSKIIEKCWLIVFSLLIMLYSYSAFAALTCDAGFETDSFSAADYTRLAPIASPPAPRTNQAIDGNGTESYLIGSNSLALNGALTQNSTNVYQSATVANTQVFQLAQDFADKNSSRTVSYTFKNKFTDQAQPLNKLSLSIYDIDSSIAGFDSQNTRYFSWFDQVTINGFTSTGAPVAPIVESKGAGITSTAPYRQNSVTSSAVCNGLDENCRLSVTFTDPVVRVDVVYGNNPALNYSSNNLANNDPAIQVVNIKFDSYCYKPQPRLTYTKALSTSRKKNTDQFTVQIKDNADNSVVTSGITTTTTTGTGNTITNGTGTTGTFKVDPTKTYTLTESAASENTNLIDYTASYTCKRSNGTTVTTLDPNNLQMTYGDNWNCTVNNSPNYVFSGIVFNDNGGIVENNSSNLDTNTKSDISSRFTGNNNYFNGKFEREIEQGIYASGLQVRLTDCGADGGTNIAGTTAKNVSDAPATLGQFKFTVPASALAGKSRVCLVQTEPSAWKDSGFSVDTTSNSREVTLVNGTLDYKTENDGSRNLDFGEVKANYASLVLIKSQHVNDCDINANYDGISFSTAEINDIEPGKCIAYKIEAYNRGHVALNNIRITDILKKTPVESKFHLPVASGISATLRKTDQPTSALINIGDNGVIITEPFDLNNTSTTTPSKRTLYFNTKYGTTVDP